MNQRMVCMVCHLNAIGLSLPIKICCINVKIGYISNLIKRFPEKKKMELTRLLQQGDSPTYKYLNI